MRDILKIRAPFIAGISLFAAVSGCSDSSRFGGVNDALKQPSVAANAATDNLSKSSNSDASAAAQGEKVGNSPHGDGAESSTVISEVGSNPAGLSDGHFDLDTSTRLYAFNKGQVDSHTHAFDDAYNVTGVDFFKIQEADHVEIDEAILDAGKRFVLVVVNSNLSPGAVLKINGKEVSAVQYATDFAALLKKGSPLPVYTLGQASVAGDSRLTNFSINFPVNAISSGGLVGLSSGNVKKNNPGANGEYRNGALTIQAIDVDGLSLDLTTGAASLESRLLWETNLYWHKE